MKTLSLLILTLFCTISVNAQPWIVPGNGNIYYYGGNVGIGTTTPLTKLHVDGTPSNSLLNVLSVNNNLNGLIAQNNGAAITIGYSNSYYTKIATVYEQNNPSYLQPSLAFYTMYNSYLAGSEVERMRISSNGNVGIGTTNPSYKLHVSGGDLGLDQPYALMFANGQNIRDNSNGGLVINSINYKLQLIGGTDPTNGLIELQTNNTVRMTVINNGNVGIGTTTPGNKLEVNGTIRAKEVKVESGWADYVFDQGYNLQDLSEVELYINKHKHLPDVPDANEVEKNGVNLGEMNALLLKKIEELTLYAITQNKKVEALTVYSSEQNSSLKEQAKKIETLEKTVNILIAK